MPASGERMERRLAAVFAADVAGYTRLMERDEVGTLRRLTAHRDIMDRQISAHGGRIANTAGDSVLAEFPSVVDAVDCAVAVQDALGGIADTTDADDALRFRIAVHVGDVLVKAGDLFGDTVNIAARLQALAAPGGVCISGEAHAHVRKSLPLAFADLGLQQVKNVAEPVRAYIVQTGASAALDDGRSTPLPLPDKPSIAVLPFTNMSGDAEQAYFADGMAEDLLTGLARIRWLFVIARNSSFVFKGQAIDVTEVGRRLGVRYILEGSVRKAANRVRITCELIDAATGAQLWSERYDRDLTDIFELQDEITQNVVAAIEPSVRMAEIARTRRKRPDNLDAYDFLLRAVAHMYESRPGGLAKAMDYVARALEISPDYAEAHGVAAWCYFAKSLWEGSLPAPHREAMLQHARAVQQLQAEDASTLAHAAIALALATRDYDAALEMINRAIAINPSSVHAHGHGAVINTWAGHYGRSVELSNRALRLSPLDPLRVMPLAGQAGAWLMQGDYDNAVAYARRALQVYPTHTPSFLIMIVSLVRLDRMDEAKTAAQQFLAVSPTYRIIPDAPVLANFVTELRQAGLPG